MQVFHDVQGAADHIHVVGHIDRLHPQGARARDGPRPADPYTERAAVAQQIGDLFPDRGNQVQVLRRHKGCGEQAALTRQPQDLTGLFRAPRRMQLQMLTLLEQLAESSRRDDDHEPLQGRGD